nr:taste receptor type 2 member 14-like [Cavia porcellus]
MVGILKFIFTIILAVEFIIGIVVHVFIALVNYMDWIKRRNISLVDQILTSLVISRIGLLCSVQTHATLFMIYPGLVETEKVFRMITFTWVVTNHFSIWFAMCLTLFYFLKIANFANSMFLYLKWRVKKVVLMNFLMSLFFLLFNIIAIHIEMNVWHDESKRNVSYSFNLKNFKQFPGALLSISSMFMLIPFTMSLIACLLLIFSLWKHLKKMQHNAKGSRNASTTAHRKAMQTVISFLLLYAIYLFCLIMQITSFKFLEKDHIIFFEHAVGIAVPSGHSLVLILGNRKLRQAFFSVVWWLRSRPKGMQSLGLKSISGHFGIFFRKNSS